MSAPKRRLFDEKEFNELFTDNGAGKRINEGCRGGEKIKDFIDASIRKAVGEVTDEIKTMNTDHYITSALRRIRNRYGLADKPGEGKP